MKKIFNLLAAGFFLAAAGLTWADGHLNSRTDSQPVRWFTDASPTGGWSPLTRTNGMIVIATEAYGLVPGDAFTVWWVVFNNPAGGSDGICGEDDFSPDGIANAQIAVCARRR